MSTGGGAVVVNTTGFSELEVGLKSGGNNLSRKSGGEKVLGTTLKKSISTEIVAKIDTQKCVNCGVCRETCPGNAIAEFQRQICRICPTCTAMPAMSVGRMKALPTETSCTSRCPLGISPQGYVGLTKAGKFEEAYELIWKKNPLLSVCARVCHHPCEQGCKRGILVDSPIQIRKIKHYLSEKVDYTPPKYIQVYEEKVAVIGAGPAGLTAGHYLASLGYDVTIYEEAMEAGGMLIRGIPEFRLDRAVVAKEIQKLVDAGLCIHLGAKLNRASMEELKTEFDAVIVATGAPKSKELFLPGWRNAGVMTAMDFMERTNNHLNMRRHLGQLFQFKGGRAVIIGGGAVAIDCARTAVRVGASKVTVVCLEEGNQVPAHPWELQEVRDEGIEIMEGYAPVEFQAELFPTLTGVKFEKVTSMSKDADGKFVVETDKSDVLEIPCEWVVQAIGQMRDLMWNEIAEDGVFFAGDYSSNKCSVVDAMASGKDTAYAVDAALRGRQMKVAKQGTDRLQPAPVNEKLFPYNFRKTTRPETHMAAPETRKHNFQEVEGVFTDQEAFIETDACLGCGYSGVDPEKCLGCGLCQQLCPKGGVITMVAKEEGSK